jgi:ATP:ADP antiporter, AAA family
MASSEAKEFSKWRNFLWPVHSFELKKLVPMLLIFFLITFNYNVLRTMNDTLIVTAKSSGAEVIPFIKVWVMFPCSILLTFLFTRLSNRFKRDTVFYVMVSIFLTYYAIFAFILYPIRESLHAHVLADRLQEILPVGLKGLIAMVRYWTFISFYVMSELWGNIIVFLLFWGFANQVTRLDEAKRFYGLFGIGANLSVVAAGVASVYLCRQTFNFDLPFGSDNWEQTLVMLVSLVLISGVAALGLFRWFNSYVMTDPRYADQVPVNAAGVEEKTVKGNMSMRENFRFLFNSRYLLSIATIVISYNMIINLVEVVWKHKVRELYPNPSDYNIYMNQVTAITGVLATLSALFISGNSIRKCGWTFTAMLTPVVLLVTSIGFFTFFFLQENFSATVMSFIGVGPLAIVVFFGSAQNILSRAAKYTVFDASREMSFIPLSEESKIKGKAVVDGICSRLGKSGGSLIHQGLFLTFSTINASAPYIAGFMLAIISLWIVATRNLGSRFAELTSQEPAAKPHGTASILATASPSESRI